MARKERHTPRSITPTCQARRRDPRLLLLGPGPSSRAIRRDLALVIGGDCTPVPEHGSGGTSGAARAARWQLSVQGVSTERAAVRSHRDLFSTGGTRDLCRPLNPWSPVRARHHPRSWSASSITVIDHGATRTDARFPIDLPMVSAPVGCLGLSVLLRRIRNRSDHGWRR